MNGKYPPRGGASFRGSGQYGYYQNQYYVNRGSSRGGPRGGFRGRSSGYYGSPVGYGHSGYANPNGINSIQYSSNPVPAPTSSTVPSITASTTEVNTSVGGVADIDTPRKTDYQNYERGSRNIEDGYGSNTALTSSAGSSGNTSNGSDMNSEIYDGMAKNSWGNFSEYRNGNINSGFSPGFRGKSRGRGTVRGIRGNRGTRVGGNYYGRNGSYDYNTYDQSGGQYYYNNGIENYGKYGSSNSAGYAVEGYEYHVTPEKDIATEQHVETTSTKESEEAAIKEAERVKNEEEKQKESERERERDSEFREKHWVGRIKAMGDMKKKLSGYFDELDAVNSNLLEIGARKMELEIDVQRYNRVLRAEDERVRLAEEKLEAMNFTL